MVLGAVFNFVERGEGLLYFGCGEDADGSRLCPGAVHRHFVRQQTAIERKEG